MAFNNGFPATYQQMYPYQMQFQQPSPRMAEVVPVESVQAAESFPVAVGTTTIMIGKDDAFVAIKSNGVNGQSSLTIYDRRPPELPKPEFDPSAYVRRDEIAAIVAEALKEAKE